MRLSLFTKIFASFWLTSIVIAVAVAWSTFHMVSNHRSVEMRERIDRAGAALAIAATAIEATDGREGLSRWLGALNEGRVGGGPLLLLDAQGLPLPGSAPLPPGAPASITPDALRKSHDLHLFALGDDARSARWLGIAPRPKHPPPGFLACRAGPRHPLRTELGLVRLGITVLVGGLVCWLLARHLTRPIRELQVASARLARGDFAVEIDRRTLARRDELAALARDFVQMAAKLKTLLDAQRQLLRDVSHELRSPLARLQVAAALARRKGAGLVDGEVDRIELETARVDELIGQLLTLMRLEAVDGALPTDTVDLSGLLETVARDAEFEAAALGVGVKARIAPGLCVRGSADLLRSAVDNIVRNALRHTAPHSRVALTAALDPGSSRLVVTVRDHGPGVPDAMLERIFDDFVRVDEAREQRTGGTGLGLAIARAGVKAHGGGIVARNIATGGLEVQIRLPAAG